MFVGITNTPRDYAWGSNGAISELLGVEASGAPEAELWLGAHHGSPSGLVGRDGTLADIVDGRLPFLLKVLAAGSPLSLQAHPTMDQAREGFDRENALGIALDAPERNYKDAFHKPELIYALSGRFEALCGFRAVEAIRETAETLDLQPLLDRLDGPDALRETFEWLITRGDGVDELVAQISGLPDDAAPELATVHLLAGAYPGDAGIAISLMLHRVTLARGEVLYLPAGNIHAYLSGVGIELMAASDNVLRGGLTPKHIDVPELLQVLDFTPTNIPYLAPEHPSDGVSVYRPDVPDFVLVAMEGNGSYSLDGPAIMLCTAGSSRVVGGTSSAELSRGEAVYVTADEASVEVSGTGTVFIATTGRPSTAAVSSTVG